MQTKTIDRLTANFAFSICLIAAMAVCIRLVFLSLSDAGVGDADATARIFYALKWLEDPFIFVPTTWPPLQFYLYGLALRIFPDPVYTPLLVNIFFGALLVAVMGYFVKQLTKDRQAGLFAAAIVAFYPLAIRCSLVAVPEVILNFLIFLALYLLLKAGVGQPEQLKTRYVIAAAVTMAAAEWTHMPAWYLMPVSSILLLGRWRHWTLYVAIGALPIAAFLFHIHSMHSTSVPPQWLTYSYDNLSRIHQLAYYPALMIKTLSSALILLAIIGFIQAWQTNFHNRKLLLFPSFCFVTLTLPYLFFVFAWDRMRPKEALLLALLIIPYASMGMVQLMSLVRGRIAKSAVIAAVLCILLVLPYNWKYMGHGNIFPIPRTAPEYRQLATWLNQNLEPDDSIVFDHLPLWSDFYLALATRRMPNQVFLTLDTFSPTILPRLIKFVAERQPKFLVLSKRPATVSAALELRYNSTDYLEIAWEPTLQVELSKRLETEHVCIYGMSE